MKTMEIDGIKYIEVWDQKAGCDGCAFIGAEDICQTVRFIEAVEAFGGECFVHGVVYQEVKP